MEAHHQQLAEELFETVEVDPPNVVIEAGDERLLDVGVGGATTLLFRDRALGLLRELQERLAQSALAAGGPAPGTLEQLLLAACREAQANGAAAGVAFLDAELAKPKRTWRIFDPINVAFPGGSIAIAGCTLHAQLPGDVPRRVLEPSGLSGEFIGAVLEAEVEAADLGSARLIASDRFAEARAVLTVIDRTACRVRYSPLAVDDDPQGVISVTVGGRGWNLFGVVDGQGRLSPRYAPLSDAAAKPEQGRTDWERRTVAAARWFANGAETTWPGEALTSAMTALETLLLKGREKQKGKPMAQAVARDYGHIHPVGESASDWIRRLYRERNQAVHAGRDYLDDLDIDRLLDLVQVVVRRAIWHLHPLHRSSGACATWAETRTKH